MLKTATNIIKKLNQNGYEAYFVGGCVRDELIGLTPKDYDVTTNARGHQLLELFPGSKLIGQSYEICLVDGVEVAPYRMDTECDGYDTKAVYDVSLEDDLSRRDFTINAIAMDRLNNYALIDPFDGLHDLNRKIIRFVGDPHKRLSEHWIRAVHAARFAARFGFEIEETALTILKENASMIAEKIIPEGLMLEFEKARPFFPAFILKLDEIGLLCNLFPILGLMKGLEQNPEYHPEGDCFAHTMRVLYVMRTASPILPVWMAALFHDTGKVTTTETDENGKITSKKHERESARIAEGYMNYLKVSNEFKDLVVNLCLNHMKILHSDITKKLVRRLIRDYGKEFVCHLYILTACDAMGGSRDGRGPERLWKLINEIMQEKPRPQSPISGKEIMERYSIEPGPEVGKLKNIVADLQLERDETMTKEEAWEVLDDYINAQN